MLKIQFVTIILLLTPFVWAGPQNEVRGILIENVDPNSPARELPVALLGVSLLKDIYQRMMRIFPGAFRREALSSILCEKIF